MKYHFILERGVACNRDAKVITDNLNQVTCINCKNSPEWINAKAEQDARREAAFWEQTPVPVMNPWTHENMECSQCEGGLFRERDRDLWTFWFQCADCGKLQGYPTETGMCQ